MIVNKTINQLVINNIFIQLEGEGTFLRNNPEEGFFKERTMKINTDPFFKALLILIPFCIVAALPMKPNCRYPAKVAKIKSKLKQISTTVAMYYVDTEDYTYPQNPSVFEIDSSLINTDDTSNWLNISLKSPYIFFPFTGEVYTGAQDKPLAMNWEPFKFPPYHVVVWEDGHVSNNSREEAEELINSSVKAQMTRLLYKLTFKNNQALQ